MIAAITWAVRFRTARPRSLWRKVPLWALMRLYVAWWHTRNLLR